MVGTIENLYILQKKDIAKAGLTLSDAFQYDAIWRQFFKDEATLEQKGTLFQAPVRYCNKYGMVYASSENLEGVAAWVPGDLADMTIWRLIQSGAVLSGIKSLSACTKLARQQQRILKPLEHDRRKNMKGRSYLYLMVIGVATEYQRQGFGSKLLRGLVEKSEQTGIPIYTETQTESNVKFYESLGFKQIKKIFLPVIDLPQWELIREPET
jgi:ribosomal protein S18 acetylase RimI-like enzyme